METKIKQEYEEGLNFLRTDTGEDSAKTEQAEKKVMAFLMIQTWNSLASRVENGEDVFSFMSEGDMDECSRQIHKLTKNDK